MNFVGPQSVFPRLVRQQYFIYLFEQYSTCIFISCSKKESSGSESLSVVATDNLCRISGCGGKILGENLILGSSNMYLIAPSEVSLLLLFEVYLFAPCEASLLLLFEVYLCS